MFCLVVGAQGLISGLYSGIISGDSWEAIRDVRDRAQFGHMWG